MYVGGTSFSVKSVYSRCTYVRTCTRSSYMSWLSVCDLSACTTPSLNSERCHTQGWWKVALLRQSLNHRLLVPGRS